MNQITCYKCIVFTFFFRKKHKKEKERKLGEVKKIIEEEPEKNVEIRRTKAEIAFQKMQEKMVNSMRSII